LSQRKARQDQRVTIARTNDGFQMPVFVLPLLLLLPGTASAHVRWFVATGQPPPSGYMPFSLSDPAVLAWLLLGLAMIAASRWLDRHLRSPDLPRLPRAGVLALLPYGTGVSLLLSAWAGSVLAPHYQWSGGSHDALLAMEALAGALLLFPPLVFMGACLLLVVYAGLLTHAGLPALLEYLNVAGIGLFLALQHAPRRLRLPATLACPVPVLRISTGLALVTLAMTEKLLRPDYAEAFIQAYPWNFMQNLGLEQYSDRLFVLSVGSMEAILGLLLILGSTTRLTVLVISGFMLASNLTFFLQDLPAEALTEITGHLPIICTALILIVFGSDKTSVDAVPDGPFVAEPNQPAT
jgi:uncharacterized membrane protein YphA (DoxX/SURF4 family)